MYSFNESCIKLKNLLSKWFEVHIGVKQGDSLFTTLFNILIDDLAMKMGPGVRVGNDNVLILLYADDIAIIRGALGGLISKFKPYKGIGYSTFKKEYEQ